jgi:hypothetical protein
MKIRVTICLIAAGGLYSTLATAQPTNLVTNGDFESGGSSWVEWSSPGGWTTGVFAHDYASGVTIWPPDPYPYAGSGSHGQHVGTNAVHGGIYQVIDVFPGYTYDVSGVWSGGIGESGSPTFDVAWFEVTVYQGAVGAAEVDAAPGPDDVIIAKREYNGQSIVSFGWESFGGSFEAEGSQITLAFKTGKVGSGWHPIAAFHDEVAVIRADTEIPTLSTRSIIILISLLAASGVVVLSRRMTV